MTIGDENQEKVLRERTVDTRDRLVHRPRIVLMRFSVSQASRAALMCSAAPGSA